MASKKASQLIADAEQRTNDNKIYKLEKQLNQLKAELTTEKRLTSNLRKAVESAAVLSDTLDKTAKKSIPLKSKPKKKAAKHIVRVVVPDSHGEHIDIQARDAILEDTELLVPDEIVWLGDHLDCGGTFSSHQRNYTNEKTESYMADVAACNLFIDGMQQRAPNAENHYIYGNHEQHVERWAARNFESHKDAEWIVDLIGPAAALKLKDRGFKYYVQSEKYCNLSIPGAIKLGKCHFVHGISHAKHAASVHLERFSANVVFGHVHRQQSVGERTVTCSGFGAWCPGTLAKLQPLYRHTAPTSWQHGYGLQFINLSTGTFVHFNVPIVDGVSLMRNVVDAVGQRP